MSWDMPPEKPTPIVGALNSKGYYLKEPLGWNHALVLASSPPARLFFTNGREAMTCAAARSCRAFACENGE
jgi:hypothetical protein